MLLIPSLELKGGKCVRQHKTAVEHAHDPVELASQWVKAGARRLQLHDLDSVTSGKAAQAALVKRIVAACPGVPVQVAGGMRSEEAVLAYIESGAEFVVLGTRAVTTPHLVNDLCLEYPGHIVVGLEVKAGKLATEGWSKFADTDVQAVAEHFQREGAAAIVYTRLDSGTDGAYIESAAQLARAVAIPVMAGGGVANLKDVKSLCATAGEDLLGAIVADPLYDSLEVGAAQKLADSLVARA